MESASTPASLSSVCSPSKRRSAVFFCTAADLSWSPSDCRQAARMASFKWVNTTLGNIKSAITGTYQA